MEETVKKDCFHKDCMYRGRIAGYETCDYALMVGHSRGCSISGCDKYRKGKRSRRSELNGVCWSADEGDAEIMQTDCQWK